MREPLSSLDGRTFDSIVIGGGINGASAVQNIAANGHDVLIVEKDDFGSGSSSRSSRLLHCGLRYLAPGRSLWDFVWHPSRLLTALRMARGSMIARAEFVEATSRRARSMVFAFPIYRNGPYRAWQIDIAFFLLRLMWPKGPPLEYRRISATDAKRMPLVKELRNLDDLHSVAIYREYQFDWPERLCIDCIIDAERMGAVARNYTSATLRQRDASGSWRLTLTDQRDGTSAEVRAKVVVNTTGIWTDVVNAQASPSAKRRVLGTKGCHIVVKLPSAYAGHGIATLNSKSEPFYCIPWHDLHFFGPTETVYEGDKDDVHVTPGEQAWLLAEANCLFPGIQIGPENVVLTWAGVRPLTYDPSVPFGNRSKVIHDLSTDGLPNVLAITAGPVTTYRQSGIDLAGEVAKRVSARRPSRAPDLGPRLPPENDNSPFLIEGDRSVRLSDLQHAVSKEHAVKLTDMLFRRTGLGWRHRFTDGEIDRAASVLATELRLSPEARTHAVDDFYGESEQLFGVRSTEGHDRAGANSELSTPNCRSRSLPLRDVFRNDRR